MTMMNSEQPSTNWESSSQTSGINQSDEKFAGETRAARKDLKALAQWTSQSFMTAKNARWRDERQWYLNLSFYFGKQHVQFNDVNDTSTGNKSNSLYTPKAPYYRSRPVINQIRPRMRTEMAKLTHQQPTAFVTPASTSDRDMYAAKAGEEIWDSLYRENKIGSVLRRAVFWTSTCGNGFIKTYWDDYTRDTGSDIQGSICIKPVTPFNIVVPDLMEEEIEEQPFVMHVAVMGAEKASNLYGKPINFESGKANLIDNSFLSVMGVDQWNKGKRVIVVECWIKPGATKLMPQGGMFTLAGGQIVAGQEGWPYIHNMYPFAHISHVASGKFYRNSVVEDLIPLQKEYNRTRGQIIEAKNKMAKPQLVAEQGSVDTSKITSEPGLIITYRPGFSPPKPLPLESLPSYVSEEVSRIKMDLDEISGQHEVSRGQVPPGVTAATAISFLQEQDDTKLSYSFESVEEGIEKIAKMDLAYVKQFWDEKRLVKVTGPDGSFDVKSFLGSDLRDNTDIRIEAGSSLPTSKAAKQSFIMDLMKMGFIDPQKGLEVMEMGGINKIYATVKADIRQAQRENLKMAQITPEVIQKYQQEAKQKFLQDPANQAFMQQGRILQGPNGDLMEIVPGPNGQPESQPVQYPLVVPVNTWDDHRLHIQKHNDFRKSQAFEKADVYVRELFEAHVQQHIKAIMSGAAAALPPESLTPEQMQSMNSGNPEQYKETERNSEQANNTQSQNQGQDQQL